MNRTLPSHIRDVALQVKRYWGTHLYVALERAGGAPRMNWHTVVLPKEAANWSSERLTAILLHEWGHRMVSPVSPERGHLWAKAAEEGANTSLDQAQFVVNLVTDLWIDRFYLESPDWSGIYLRGEVANVEEMLFSIDLEAQEGCTLAQVVFGLYRRLLALPNAADIPDAIQHLQLEPSAEEKADEVWSVAFDSSLKEIERVIRVATYLKDLLPQGVDDLLLLSDLQRFAEQLSRLPDRVKQQLFTEAQTAEASQAVLNAIGTPEELEHLRLTQKRLKLYAAVVPVVQQFLQRQRRQEREGYKPWKVGRPVRELDAVASIERAARLLPGETTLAPRLRAAGHQRGKGMGVVQIIIDDSGSTAGQTLQREQEAAFAVIAAARHHGDSVGCVVFGSDVTHAIEPTSRYHTVEETIAGLSSNSGGTRLQPALELAYEHVRPVQKGAFLIMTDAYFHDTKHVKRLLERVPHTFVFCLFCFGQEEQIRNQTTALTQTNVRVFAASDTTSFSEEALQEIYG